MRGERADCVLQRSAGCCAHRSSLVVRSRPVTVSCGRYVRPVCAEMMRGRGVGRKNGRGVTNWPRYAGPGYSLSIFWAWVAAGVCCWRSMRSYVDSIVSVRYLGPRVSPILSDLGPESGSEVNPINKQFRSVIVGASGARRPLDSLVQASGQKLTLGL